MIPSGEGWKVLIGDKPIWVHKKNWPTDNAALRYVEQQLEMKKPMKTRKGDSVVLLDSPGTDRQAMICHKIIFPDGKKKWKAGYGYVRSREVLPDPLGDGDDDILDVTHG